MLNGIIRHGSVSNMVLIENIQKIASKFCLIGVILKNRWMKNCLKDIYKRNISELSIFPIWTKCKMGWKFKHKGLAMSVCYSEASHLGY